MWIVHNKSILYSSWPDTVSFPVFSPDWSSFAGSILSLPPRDILPSGYDDWVQQFPLHEEIALVEEGIWRAQKGERIYVRGISSSESVQLLREYYMTQGYTDTFDRFSIPWDELLTASISLRHFLWCDKDKEFLEKKVHICPLDKGGQGGFPPPLRTSHDLRAIQQAVRMGIIPCIDVEEDASYLSECITRELIPLFQLGQVCRYNWEKYGFVWTENFYNICF